MVRVCVREGVRNLVAILIALLFASMLAAISTGFGVDERELDPRLNEESRAAIRQAAENSRLSPSKMLQFARGTLKGDFGVSTSLGRPVAELLAERVKVTLPAIGISWLATVLAGLGIASYAALRQSGTANQALAVCSTAMLSVPCAVLALLFAWMRLPVMTALMAAALPHAFRFAQSILAGGAGGWSVLSGRARGVGGPGLAVRYLLLPAAPELIGVASLTLNFLIGAVIPIEALSNVSGLGHLVWLGAIGRDIPLIAAMTILVAAGTLAAGGLAEIAAASLRSRRMA